MALGPRTMKTAIAAILEAKGFEVSEPHFAQGVLRCEATRGEDKIVVMNTPETGSHLTEYTKAGEKPKFAYSPSILGVMETLRAVE